MELTEYLNSINKTKVNLMRDSQDPKAVTDYPAYIVRRLLSYHMDAILFANEINCIPVDSHMEYEFFLQALPKKNRFAKMEKKQTVENVDIVKQFYNYSDKQAMEVLDLHTEDDLKMMRQRLSVGGVVRSPRTIDKRS